MVITKRIKHGPLTKAIIRRAHWTNTVAFPPDQAQADEFEKLLSYLRSHKQFDRYSSMFCAKMDQLDSALAEARASYFFNQKGFSIVSWEPKGSSNKPGEFEIKWAETNSIFVEVKAPRWEGELDCKEKHGQRRHQKKYPNGEARWADPIGKCMEVAEAKALPKFLDNKPNMLVIVDDHLFISTLQLTRDIVEPGFSSKLAEPGYKILGGILIFNTNCSTDPISYRTFFIKNPSPHLKCAVPTDAARVLSATNDDSFKPRIQTIT